MLKPGDIVKALHHMRAWETDLERGRQGYWINEGEVATVIHIWIIGDNVRIRVLVSNRIAMFSHDRSHVMLNWMVVDKHDPIPQAILQIASVSGSV